MIRNWPTKKLGEVCEIVGGGTPSTSVSEYWDGDVVWVTPKDTGKLDGVEIFDSSKKITEEGLKKSSAKLLPKGAVILSSRAPIGYVAIAGVPLATNQGCRSFICDESKLYNRYLLHFLLTQTEHLNMLGGGSTFKEISGSKLKELEIPLPPLSEQKKIVAKLERVLAKISEAKKLRAEARENADNLLPAELHKIFSTPHHIHPYKLENVGMSSRGKNGWEEKTIEEVTELVTKGTTPKTLGHAYTESGVPFLKAENVNGGVIDASSTQTFISKQTHDILSRSKTKDGDVLMTIAGTIGRLGWVSEHAPEMNMNQAVAIIRPKQNLIFSPYLAYILSAGISQSQVSSGIVKAAIPNFSLGMIKKIKIPLPPLAEQKKIVARLDSLSEKVGKIKNLQSATQNDFTALEQSLLHQAFAGHGRFVQGIHR